MMLKKLPVIICLMLLISGCSQKSTTEKENLPEIARKARRAGYKVTYNETLTVRMPDFSKKTGPDESTKDIISAEKDSEHSIVKK